MEVKQFSLSSYQPGEMVDLADQLVAQTLAPWDARLIKRTAKVSMYSATVADALKSKRKSDYTQVLAEQDDRRDDGYRSFRFAVMSAAHSDVPEIRSAGQKLLEILERHETSFSKLGYSAKTVEMKSLAQETAHYSAEITTAQAERQYQQMTEAMTAFNLIVQEKLEKESAETGNTVTEGVKKLAHAVDLLRNKVEEFLEDEEEGIESLVLKYNEVIDKANAKVKSRRSRSQNSQDNANTDGLSTLTGGNGLTN